MEAKLKHLEFIQQAISRMAASPFLLKGWTVTVIAAMFTLAEKGANGSYLLLGYFPAVMFWILDGYFLSQERRFRSLYDHVAKLDEGAIDFSMDTGPFKDTPARNKWSHALCSPALLVYYGILLVAVTIVWLLVG